MALVCTLGGKTEEIFYGPAQLCSEKKKAIKGLPEYKGAILQVRNIGAYKFVPVLSKKKKKYGT